MVVAYAVFGRGGPLQQSRADGQVTIDLSEGESLNVARQEVTAMASTEWQATRVAEDTETDPHQVRLAFVLPGASLDAALAALQDFKHAEHVSKRFEVDPGKLVAAPLASPGSGAPRAPSPVRLEVVLVEHSGPGVWVPVAIALVVLLALLGGLWWYHRRRPVEDAVYY